MFLALKEMKKDKGRFFLIISIVVLISYLVFFLTALALGLATDNRTAVDHWNANRVVLKSGTNSNILSSMFDVELLSEFDGHDISPINIGRSVGYINGNEDDKNTLDLVLIGLYQDSQAYPEVIEGELPENDNEVLASISLKNEDEIEIGDTIVLSMNDREFTVTGFTEDSKFNVSSVLYTDLQMASAAMLSFVETPEGENGSEVQMPEETEESAASETEIAESEIAESDSSESQSPEGEGIQSPEGEGSEGGGTTAAEDSESSTEGEKSTEENAEEDEVGPIDGEIEESEDGATDGNSGATEGVPERVSGVLIHDEKELDLSDDFEVVSIDDFIWELPGYLAQVLTFGLMIIFLVLISTIVLGVFMFIITMQKKQTFGIMKVQGISNRYIAISVIVQTFLVSLFGVLVGLGLTYLSELLLPYTVPFKSNILFYGIIGLGIILISLLGAIFSVRGVAKVDPLEVLD